MDIGLLDKLFLLNLFDHLPPFVSYFFCCLGAIFAGTVVGKEREKVQKAAGLRTFAMVALGSCVFTITSRLMIGNEVNFLDGARIPAQIVSGVGFLGAGAVFRSGRIVTGLTTAAGIWATAAVGLVFGLGFVTFGICITFLVFLLLWGQSFLEKKSLYSCKWTDYQIHVDCFDGKGPILLKEIVYEWGHKIKVIENQVASPHVVIWQISLCQDHRPHQRFLSDLASQPLVTKITVT